MTSVVIAAVCAVVVYTAYLAHAVSGRTPPPPAGPPESGRYTRKDGKRMVYR